MPEFTSITDAVATIILSAIGSKSLPKADCACKTLARYPSKKSVKLANKNSNAHSDIEILTRLGANVRPISESRHYVGFESLTPRNQQSERESFTKPKKKR